MLKETENYSFHLIIINSINKKQTQFTNLSCFKLIILMKQIINLKFQMNKIILKIINKTEIKNTKK